MNRAAVISARKDDTFEFQLIEEIRSRPYLYDYNDPKNKSVVTKAIAWKEIAKICNQPAERCLARWKSLRDRYLRELKAVRETNKKVRWIYFEPLSFLKKYLKTLSNTNSTPKKSLPSTSSNTCNYENQADEDSDSFVEIFNIKQEVTTVNNSYTNNTDLNSHSRSQKSENNYANKSSDYDTMCGTSSGNVVEHHNFPSHENDILHEPEIEFDISGIVNRFNDTIKAFKEISTVKRTEDENFGILVADMLSTLTFEKRTKAKAHLIQYLADLHIQQISSSKPSQ